MPRVRIRVGTAEHYSRQVSWATQLLPTVAMLHVGQVTIEGSPAALEALAAELLGAAEEARGPKPAVARTDEQDQDADDPADESCPDCTCCTWEQCASRPPGCAWSEVLGDYTCPCTSQ
jgi:hypothetical protein